MDYRQRKIENLGTEEYLKKNAEQAKKWREKNPEKVKENNENKKNSKEQNYNVYKRSASLKNLEFELTYEDYLCIVENNCNYCGIVQDKGFNGIDRKDQMKGYILDNCVSCCKICNYMKGSTSDEVFIKRVEHILTFQNKIQGKLYPECFANHKGTSFEGYKKRALDKNLDFIINQENYKNLTNGGCFICGKIANEEHTNGIDRFDNKKGYVIDNVKSCCAECNYIKKDVQFDEIIDKFKLIHEKYKCHLNNFIESHEDGNKIIVKSNKKSKDEIENTIVYRKNKQQLELVARYNDDEYKNAKALELANLRKDKI